MARRGWGIDKIRSSPLYCFFFFFGILMGPVGNSCKIGVRPWWNSLLGGKESGGSGSLPEGSVDCGGCWWTAAAAQCDSCAVLGKLPFPWNLV